jgi:hypothetical protein
LYRPQRQAAEAAAAAEGAESRDLHGHRLSGGKIPADRSQKETAGQKAVIRAFTQNQSQNIVQESVKKRYEIFTGRYISYRISEQTDRHFTHERIMAPDIYTGHYDRGFDYGSV